MSIERLNKSMARLNEGHTKNFDPVSFAYIQSLSSKVIAPKDESDPSLLKKVLARAEQYLREMLEYERLAEEILLSIVDRFPSQAETAQSLFDHCKYKQIKVLNERLSRQLDDNQVLDELRRVTADINQHVDNGQSAEAPDNIDKLMQQQEHSERIVDGLRADGSQDGAGEQLELHSMKLFRESVKHFDIDKIIARAINEGPANPGPINPQMLAIKSLSHMSDLSPSYLRRFAAYVETLLWLEKNAVKLGVNKLKF